MLIELCRTNDSDNVVNKSIEVIATFNIALKKPSDITNLTIILLVDDFDVLGCNYVIIDDLKRNYFIRGIERVNNRMVKIYLECDYLETYKAEILASHYKFRRKFKTGDNGSLTVVDTGQSEVSNYYGGVVFGDDVTNILTVVRG